MKVIILGGYVKFLKKILTFFPVLDSRFFKYKNVVILCYLISK